MFGVADGVGGAGGVGGGVGVGGGGGGAWGWHCGGVVVVVLEHKLWVELIGRKLLSRDVQYGKLW